MQNIIPIRQNPRYAWVDVLKFFGIFSIYVGHLGTAAGQMYPFVFQFHVALFFLASGFFAPKSEEQALMPFILKKFTQIMVPYFAFSVINIFINTLTWGVGVRGFAKLILAMVMGVRSQTVAAALWFLPCLFVVSLLYYVLKRLLHRRGLVLLVCLALYVITEIGIPYRPVGEPRMFWGIDSALCYVLYYALGAVAFPFLRDFKLQACALWQKLLLGAAFVAAGAFACIVYFKGASFPLQILPFELPKVLTLFYSAFLACLFSFLFCVLSHMFAGVSTFAAIGRSTLVLCGTEGIVKEIFKGLLRLVGLELQLNTQFAAFLYVCILLLASTYIFVPWIRKNAPVLAGAYTFALLK